MDKEKLDNLWRMVEYIGEKNHLHYSDIVALGSVFGQLESKIIEQQKEIEQLNVKLKEGR